MPTKTEELTRYDIIIPNTPDYNDDLTVFMTKCIWSRKREHQTAYGISVFGSKDEFTIYSCDLNQEDLLFLKLKFSGIAYVTPTVPNRTHYATFKAAAGAPYHDSPEARMNRALERMEKSLKGMGE